MKDLDKPVDAEAKPAKAEKPAKEVKPEKKTTKKTEKKAS